MAPIDFYFDFSSPYGYLASELIDDVGARHGRPVVWHPILLGVAFRATGAAPFPQIPLKGEYAMHDMARSARYLGLDYKHPSNFPIPTQHAARAFLWLQDRNPDQARAFAHAAYRAYFTRDINIAELDTVLRLAADLGAERNELGMALGDVALKERLKAEVDLALARGVFGSPYFIVEGEPFWGADRLPHLDKWLAEGGF
ncbi:MAG: 2-hydroxychromene-2-carboxylate isomerase [Rhodocyclaceae bacterium]